MLPSYERDADKYCCGLWRPNHGGTAAHEGVVSLRFLTLLPRIMKRRTLCTTARADVFFLVLRRSGGSKCHCRSTENTSLLEPAGDLSTHACLRFASDPRLCMPLISVSSLEMIWKLPLTLPRSFSLPNFSRGCALRHVSSPPPAGIIGPPSLSSSFGVPSAFLPM